MKRFIYNFILSSLFILIITGCAQWGGDNPLGITGGSEEGYGQNNDLYLPDPSAENTLDPELLGRWINNISEAEYEIWTFNSDGTMRTVYYQDSYNFTINGTYYTSAGSITINSSNEIMTGSYSISGNRLTISFGLVTLRFVRVQWK